MSEWIASYFGDFGYHSTFHHAEVHRRQRCSYQSFAAVLRHTIDRSVEVSVLVATMRRRNLGQKVKRCDEIPVSSWWASVRNEGIVQVCNLTSFEEYLPSYVEQCSSLERCCLCDYAPKKNSIRALPDLYTCHFNTVHRPLSLFLGECKPRLACQLTRLGRLQCASKEWSDAQFSQEGWKTNSDSLQEVKLWVLLS